MIKCLLLLLVSTLLILMSCDSDNAIATGFPEFPDQESWEMHDLGINQFFDINYQSKEDSIVFYLYSYGNDLDFSVVIDSCSYCLEDFNVIHQTNCYKCIKKIKSQYTYGDIINCSIEINGKEHIHEIAIPDYFVVSFPKLLYHNTDAYFNWLVNTDPSIFQCRFYGYDSNNQIAPDCHNWTESGNKRSTKISKSWIDLFNYNLYTSNIFAINYVRESGWMISSGIGDGSTWSNGRGCFEIDTNLNVNPKPWYVN